MILEQYLIYPSLQYPIFSIQGDWFKKEKGKKSVEHNEEDIFPEFEQ